MSTTAAITAALLDGLPSAIDAGACEVTAFGALHKRLESIADDIESDSVALVVPGWSAGEHGWVCSFADAKDGKRAAQEYVAGGDYESEDCETTWVDIYVWRLAYTLDATGNLRCIKLDEDSHTIKVEPKAPPCEGGQEHDWRSPYGVLGGLEENPGVWGHGGGVVIKEVCVHCGAYRITDTWAQRPDTGEQGLESVAYKEADEASREWVESLADHNG